jgi:hypothetical protein
MNLILENSESISVELTDEMKGFYRESEKIVNDTVVFEREVVISELKTGNN